MKEKIKRALSSREKKYIVDEHLTPAAVLVPIYQKAGESYILFTKRTEKVEYHKGQFSFPGGARNKNETPLSAALRESFEEIGVLAQDVEVLGELDDTVTVTSNYVISPFVGAIPHPYEFRINRDEVGEIIHVPVAALLDKANFREESQVRDGKTFPEYFYNYKGHVIWGATARILKQFLDLIGGG